MGNLCGSECWTGLYLYLSFFMLVVLVHSTSEVGSMLLTLRCVQPGDKAMALGLIQCAIGLFGNVPCPVLYGFIVDKACVLWERDCHGNPGHCWVYDSTLFRSLFHGEWVFLPFLTGFYGAETWFVASKESLLILTTNF